MEQKAPPKVGELVLARIEKVAQFSAQCKLIEYNDIDAFLPIREVSSGWIKNIHEFIHKGQIVVCRIIFIDKEKNSIDVSIKKVNSEDSKEKMNAYNLERRLWALFQQALKEAKVPGKEQREVYNNYVLGTFGTFTKFIKSAADDTAEFKSADLPKKLKDTVLKLIESSRKTEDRKVVYMMNMYSQNTENGITQIRNALAQMQKDGISVEYIGAPRYRLVSSGSDYSVAEGKIEKAVKDAKAYSKDVKFEIEKEKLKKEKVDIITRL